MRAKKPATRTQPATTLNIPPAYALPTEHQQTEERFVKMALDGHISEIEPVSVAVIPPQYERYIPASYRARYGISQTSAYEQSKNTFYCILDGPTDGKGSWKPTAY
ncbi:hypothetical protein JW711_01290 [Candidatus Woesearchaeota archaeon]|nr:hypothetical protein [Candidatus Woesearchaeota archaeon]